MTDYKLASIDMVIRQRDKMYIPMSPDNSNYREYLAWRAEGNTPDLPDPVPNQRITAIKAELDALDFKKIRPLAAGDTEYLATLQAQTVALQNELRALTALVPDPGTVVVIP